MKSGSFIVLDGNDGSGKATQCALLSERLLTEGIDSEKIDFPRYDTNVFGTLIGECLAGEHGDFLHLDPKIASALYALDRFESSKTIREALAQGKVIIADRYASANQIHQGGKLPEGKTREDFLQWLDHVEYEVLQIPRPGTVIYLRVPLEISLKLLTEKRAKKNPALVADQDMVETDRTYLERSSATAEWLAASQPNWHTIDCVDSLGALRGAEVIHEEIWDFIKGTLA